jgi:hypothetical protein
VIFELIVGEFYLGPKMGMDFMGFDLDDILGFEWVIEVLIL